MEILLGYEIKTAKPVKIKNSHLIVTGITQLSGKTTTLESLIKRSNYKAVVFKTKVGEQSFMDGTETAPFFRDRSDYEFVRSLIEAYAREKLIIEKGTLMRLCKGSASLVEIKRRVDEALAEGKLRGLKEEIHTRLQHYLENLIPQIQYSNLSNTLHIYDGLNIMNLERFSAEAQSLIIQSVAEEVLNNMRDVILVIPEAWKFLPQKYNNPCKRSVESFIRQGATNRNFVWIDSQDMSGVDKTPLKQVSTWILGYQAERNEVKHTLDQISLPARSKPKVNDIMKLKKGHFILSSYDCVKKVYVQPHWLDEQTAIEIAKGKKSIDEVNHQPSLTNMSVPLQKKNIDSEDIMLLTKNYDKDIAELRMDFFNKIVALQQMMNNLAEEITSLKLNMPEVNVEHIVSIVLQKMPISSLNNSTPMISENLINEVIKRLPTGNNIVYEVAPLEKIKKDFLEEIKSKIIADVSTLNDDQRKVLKYIETKEQDVTPSELITKCLLLRVGGSQSVKMSGILKALSTIECVVKTAGGRYRRGLKNRIQTFMGNHNATESEIEQVYNHILRKLL